MKKVLTLILALCMVLTAFAGCGNTAPAGESAAPAASSVEEAPAEAQAPAPAAEEAPEEAPAPAEEEASVEEAPAEEQPAGKVIPGTVAQTAVKNGEIDRNKQLPLTDDGETLSYWITTSFGASSGISSWNDHYGLKKVQELTGVKLDITECNLVAAYEQFNLMIASNDLCDIVVSFEGLYSPGADNAIEEDLIVDLLDYIEYAPIYRQLLEADPDWQASMETDEGHLASFKMLYTENEWVKQSIALRGDWLEELDMELPVTYDDYHEVLLAFKNQFDPAYCLNIGTTLGNSWFEPGFGIAVSSSGSASSNDFYVENDTVYSGFTSDRFRDYLTMLHQWYDEGIISSDYVSVGNLEFFENEYSAHAAAGDFGCIMGAAGLLSSYAAMSDDPDFEFVGGILPRNNEDETLTYLADSKLTGSDWAPSVSASCSNMELAMGFLDFFYTEEGSMIANYGLEGESYTIENGEVVLTDAILSAGDTQGALMAYKCSLSSIGDPNAGFALTSTPEGIAIMKAWTEDQTALAVKGGNASYPSDATLTAEELSEASNLLSDIATYVSEAVPGFIMGTKSLDEWDAYCADLESMGIEDAVAIYQSAYDRYIG